MSESEIESRSKFDPPAPALGTCLPSGKANPTETLDPSQLVVYPLRLCDDGIYGHQCSHSVTCPQPPRDNRNGRC